MNNYDPNKVKGVFAYVELVNKKRGELINETINLESIIDSILASYFCTDKKKRPQLLSLIIRKRLNLAAKITILETISENYQWIKEDYPKLFPHLRIIKDMRNRLSHLFLSTTINTASENLEKKQIEFLNENEEIKAIPIEEIDVVIQLAKRYVLSLTLHGLQHSSST